MHAEIVREMQHGVVLDVRVVADDDAVDVAAHHRAIPHARMRAERHVAKHDGGLGEINALAELRRFAQKCVELFHRIFHAENLTADVADVADKRSAGGSSASENSGRSLKLNDAGEPPALLVTAPAAIAISAAAAR